MHTKRKQRFIQVLRHRNQSNDGGHTNTLASPCVQSSQITTKCENKKEKKNMTPISTRGWTQFCLGRSSNWRGMCPANWFFHIMRKCDRASTWAVGALARNYDGGPRVIYANRNGARHCLTRNTRRHIHIYNIIHSVRRCTEILPLTTFDSILIANT